MPESASSLASGTIKDRELHCSLRMKNCIRNNGKTSSRYCLRYDTLLRSVISFGFSFSLVSSILQFYRYTLFFFFLLSIIFLFLLFLCCKKPWKGSSQKTAFSRSGVDKLLGVHSSRNFMVATLCPRIVYKRLYPAVMRYQIIPGTW